MLFRYVVRSQRTKARHAVEMEALHEVGEDLRWTQSAGARWRRNADGSWSRWSYLGDAWEPGTPPGFAEDVAGKDPGVSEWIVGTDGVWRAADGAPSDGQTAAPPPEDAPMEAQTSVEQAPPPHDPWKDAPPQAPTWQSDLMPVQGFTWVDGIKPSPPIKPPEPPKRGWKRRPKS